MKVGDVVVPISSRRHMIKFRVTRLFKISDIDIIAGYRIKWDKKTREWVSFGRDRNILRDYYRVFTDDDFHYMR